MMMVMIVDADTTDVMMVPGLRRTGIVLIADAGAPQAGHHHHVRGIGTDGDHPHHHDRCCSTHS